MAEPIDVWMVFHVVAATEDAAEESLDDHIEQLEGERGVISMSAEMEDAQKVDDPHPQLDEGFSKVCEVELSVKAFSDLIDIVINYGPTSVDVKGPDSREMPIGEMRDSLNSVAQMMHQFLQAGAGGMMISRPGDE